VGLGAYLSLVASIPIKPVAITLGVILIGVNILGVKRSGRLQTIVVSIVLGTLAVFVVWGLGSTEAARYENFTPGGIKGLLSATGLVFVSYAGVTKVASVAEEVKRPARNIPRGILTSILLMMVLYPALVYVMIGVTPAADLAKDVTPMSTATDQFAPHWVSIAISIVAVLALTSMANAGLLASSRYPFAMARNRLAPPFLGRIYERTATPVAAVVLTGGVMMLLIAVFPLLELAKLASAFQLLVFSLVNLALIAFRESKLDWYRPAFRSPLYPAVQIFGIVAALVLLSQMGIVPIAGAALIAGGGVLWYRVFGRSRASRESAGRDALRIRARDQVLREAAEAVARPGRASVLLAVRREISDARLRDLIRLGNSVIGDSPLEIVRIGLDDPVQHSVHDSVTDEERHFLRRVASVAEGIETDTSFAFVGGRDWRRQVLQYTDDNAIDLVLAEAVDGRTLRRSFVHDMQWLADHIESDFLFLGNRYLDAIDDIAILGSGSPLDPMKVDIAERRRCCDRASVMRRRQPLLRCRT
jgi:hypothetical protein